MSHAIAAIAGAVLGAFIGTGLYDEAVKDWIDQSGFYRAGIHYAITVAPTDHQ